MTAQSNSQSLVNALTAALDSRGLTRQRIVDYSALLSGQVGRLIFSFAYIVILTRALSLGDFGIFATCSAIGIVLSRLVGFGYVSPLFRVATTKPGLIGGHTSGFLIASLLSIPLLSLIAWGVFELLYSNLISVETFFLIVFAEVICWRGLETVIIVCNGQNRYTTGSLLGISGVAIKALAAIWFYSNGNASLNDWAFIYFASLLLIALIAILFFYPKQRLRWKPKAWTGRFRDAIGVSAAETLFYVQSELDKVLVLALGGEVLAGLYAIIMRLVDLTAVPLRALSTMLTQWIMRERKSGKGANTGLQLDAAIAAVSILGLVMLTILLSLAPNLIGENIAMGVSFLWFVLLVPAFRNAIELHTDLLYGHEKMAARVLLLICLGVLKAVLIGALLTQTDDFQKVALWLNGIFAALYGVSALITYRKILK